MTDVNNISVSNTMGPIKFVKTLFGVSANLITTGMEGAETGCNITKSWLRRCSQEQAHMYERRLKADILSAEDELAQEVSELLPRRKEVIDTLTQLDNISL